MIRQEIKKQVLPIAIIGSLFFIFGFVTWLNGILIPYLKIACELTDLQSLFVAFAFYIAYTIMALPSAWVLKKVGLKSGMMLGLWVMAIGTLVFVPAALSRTYSLFLTGLFVMGTGLAILQTASNPYITILGPKDSAAKRISILGICNKLAGAIAPLILAYYILNDGDTLIESLQTMADDQKILMLNELSRRVINPYLVMTAVLLALGVAIRLSPLPELIAPENEHEHGNLNAKKATIFGYPQLILGVIALFFYVGVEVIAGDTIIRYGLSMGIEMSTAKTFTSLTLISMIIGYIAGIALIPKVISQAFALKASAILGIVFTLAALFTTGIVSVFFIALLGLANALVWPAVWPLALDGLGKHINTGSAMLIMAISGGAIIPLIWGRMSDLFTPQAAYWVLVLPYLFILYYAIRGHRLRSWKHL